MKNLISSAIIIVGISVGTFIAFAVNPHLSPVDTVNILTTNIRNVHETPTRLKIPTLGIDTSIESLGKDKKGRMDVPKDTDNVGWYDLGTVPGKPGNAVIDGHFDSKVGPAVFFRLNDLQRGDKVVVTTAQGKDLTFIVKTKKSYPTNYLPANVFGKTDRAQLNLITCGGVFDEASQSYKNRVVVYSELTSSG